jgi:hypothetical protein
MGQPKLAYKIHNLGHEIMIILWKVNKKKLKFDSQSIQC